jgi:thiol-disulfide isomerase/thioredoxin
MDATNSSAPAANTRVRFWIALALAAAMASVYVLVTSALHRPIGTTGPAIGRRLTYLEIEPLTGDSQGVSLADLSGHVTVLNYWGTWCGPCQVEFPHIVEFATKFAGRDDFRLYAVSCGPGFDPELDNLREATERFLAANEATLPTYADQNAASRRAMAMALGQDGIGYPTTLVLDRRGIIRGFWSGYGRGQEREMQALIEELLNQPATQPAA